MSLCGIHAPTDSTWQEAFGWVSQDEDLEDVENRYILLNNIANIIGYVLSPLVGLIRIVVNAYFLAIDEDGVEWSEDERGYLKAQIARGVVELLGGGTVLWIPDLIFTINRQCSENEEFFYESSSDYSW